MEEIRKEMELEELEEVAGGKAKKRVAAGGSPNPLPPKAGFAVHKITAKDTLTRIASKYGTSINAIMAANPSIKDKNLIRTGYYLYVPFKG